MPMFRMELSRRFWIAPKSDRALVTVEIASSISPMAVDALAALSIWVEMPMPAAFMLVERATSTESLAVVPIPTWISTSSDPSSNETPFELGAVGDTVDLFDQSAVLGIEVTAVGVGQGTVQGLLGQFLHAQQDVGDLVQGAFTRLHERNAVGSVAGRLIQSPDVGLQALADGQTGSVVTGAVDAQTGAQLLHGLLEQTGVLRQMALGVQRANVGVDADSHFIPP